MSDRAATQTQTAAPAIKPAPDGVLQRACACGQHTAAGGECAECRKKREAGMLQRAATNNATVSEVPLIVHEVLRSPGQPLDAATRAFLEPRFGHDFSSVRLRVAPQVARSGLTLGDPADAFEREAEQVAASATQEVTLASQGDYDFSTVRVHAEARAAESARAVNALAYTVGRDIVFGAGRYAPHTDSGRALLAHELTHVVQQTDGVSSKALVQRQASGSSTPPAPATGGLSQEMLRQIAQRLRDAMAGLGTDETAIYAALSGRTSQQIEAIARVYQEMFERSLMADLQDELSQSELMQLGAFAPQANQGASAADMTAERLDRAMRGLGTDESAIYAALSGRATEERAAIKEAYKRRTNRELEADLRDELSGAELQQALMLLNQGMLEPEDELYLAMEGLGTDEETIARVLSSLKVSSTQIEQVEQRYREKYGDLIADLRDDLTAEEYADAMRVLRPVLQDVAFEDCAKTIIPKVRALIPVGIQKVEKAIAVLSKGWANMSAEQQATFNQFFDPSSSDFDDTFIRDVLSNFHKIRREFNNDLTVECETDSGLCSGGRLYYTYWSNIHVCPYFMKETNTERKERDFVHELTHNALMAIDRPYYNDDRAGYNAMTPRGPRAAAIPIIGPLVRVISHSDTLNSPDAYAFFAFKVP